MPLTRRLPRHAALVVALSFASLVTSRTEAQPARDPAGAEALFREGVELVDKGSWDQACPKFDKSMDLDPAVSTLVNVARCSRHFGRVATALAQLQEAQRMNRQSEPGRRRDALDKFITGELGAIEPTVPRLTIRIQAPPPGLVLTRDGKQISPSTLGEALPIDPGEHRIGASAPGFVSVERTVSSVEGRADEITLELVAAPSDTTPKPTPPIPPTAAPQTATGPRPEATGGSDTLEIAGWVTAGVGAATVVAGAVFGGLTIGESGSLPASCDPDTLRCASEADAVIARDASSRGETYSTVSSITLPLGAAALATGVVLVIVGRTSSDGPTSSQAMLLPVVGPGAAGLVLSGEF